MDSMLWLKQTRPQTTLLLFDGYIITLYNKNLAELKPTKRLLKTPCVGGWLRLLLVALSGLFYLLFWSCQNVCEALTYLLDNIYIRFGTKLYRQIVGIPMDTDCAPLVALLL